MAKPTDEPAWTSDGCVSEDQAERPKLPVRLSTDPLLGRKLRRMDDPELLERVLAGLLGLP